MLSFTASIGANPLNFIIYCRKSQASREKRLIDSAREEMRFCGVQITGNAKEVVVIMRSKGQFESCLSDRSDGSCSSVDFLVSPSPLNNDL